MRVFYAILFDSNVKDYLSEVQQIVKDGALKGNYTLYDNFHLTLQFIGEVSQSEVDRLCDCLDEIASHITPFDISIGDLGSFNRKDKHIVFCDVIKNRQLLKKLANKLENTLIKYDFEARKGQFKPHITLARQVVFNEVSVLKYVTQYKDPVQIKQVSLMLSHRDKYNKLTYTPLYTVNLGK